MAHEPRYPGSRFAAPGYLRRISIENTPDGVTLAISLETSSKGPEQEHQFHGVVDLRLRTQTIPWGSVLDLYFEEISARGMENIHFQVWDAEEEAFTFYCREMK